MKKITFLFLFVLTTTFTFGQNLITNGTFDDATGWTVFNVNGATDTNGSVDFTGGQVAFSQTATSHMGIYQSIYLEVGTYQFDTWVSFSNIFQAWGQVYIGTTEPADGADYSDGFLLNVLHFWDCGDPAQLVYAGSALDNQCNSGNADAGKFTVTEAGTIYLVLKVGDWTGSIGDSPVLIDDMSIVAANPSPVADFTTSTSTSNLDAVFTNTSTDATDYAWDFGDGNGSTDANPTHTYAAAGPYNVTLSASSTVGESIKSRVVTVGDPTNFITNSTLDDPTGWTIVDHEGAGSTNGTLTIAGGVAAWTETAAWGKHLGIYTDIYLDPGSYQFDMDVTFADIFQVWGEVYLGTVEPVQNADYAGDFQVLNAFNGWTGPFTYSGLATGTGISGDTPGQFEITTAGTYYLCIRIGGNTYGPTQAIVVDNITLYEKQALSLSDFTIEGLKVYPNPANDAWTISTTNQIIETVEIFNILGNRVISLEPNALSTKVDASHLATGVYISTISTQSGTTSRKLIKK